MRALAILLVFGAMSVLMMSADPNAVSNVFLGAVTAISVYVGWRMAHVAVDLDGDVLVVRNVPRTYRVRCDEVVSLERDAEDGGDFERVVLKLQHQRIPIDATRMPSEQPRRNRRLEWYMTRAQAGEAARALGETIGRVNRDEVELARNQYSTGDGGAR